jgi:uncharacterized protein YhbP (UPF0306 family)
MNAQTVTRIAAFLDAHHVMSLATCGRDGPHATNLFYVRDGFALIWVSDPNSRHSTDIADDEVVAATISPDCFDIDDIRGVQISGHAHGVTTDARAHARRLLEARYPRVKSLFEASSAMREVYARMEFYRLEPMRMVLIDNSRGFGHKETLELTTFPADRLRELSSTAASDSQLNADLTNARAEP